MAKRPKKTHLAFIISLLYAAFLVIFALDTPMLSLGFIIHLIPSFVVAVSGYLGLYYRKLGFGVFIFLAILSILFFKTYEGIVSFLIISFPLVLIAVLFVLPSSARTTTKKKQDA